jgi:large subunit ribosomal protein L13
MRHLEYILIRVFTMGSFTAGTTFMKPSEVKKTTFLIDAENLVLGRLAAEVAKILRGKHRAGFTPFIDTGDNVIIINADKVAVTGKKLDQDMFYWHTNHPGGIKERSKGQILDGKYPERLIKNAITRMMPKESPLARKQLKSLRVYAGGDHPHAAQNPVTLELATKNIKNKRG